MDGCWVGMASALAAQRLRVAQLAGEAGKAQTHRTSRHSRREPVWPKQRAQGAAPDALRSGPRSCASCAATRRRGPAARQPCGACCHSATPPPAPLPPPTRHRAALPFQAGRLPRVWLRSRAHGASGQPPLLAAGHGRHLLPHQHEPPGAAGRRAPTRRRAPLDVSRECARGCVPGGPSEPLACTSSLSPCPLRHARGPACRWAPASIGTTGRGSSGSYRTCPSAATTCT